MLVLSRQAKQQIVIADNITAEVREIHRNRVVLEVCAPKDVDVWRKELWIQRQKDKEPGE